MDKYVIERQFKKIGARVKFGYTNWSFQNGINILRDRKGEFFDIRIFRNENVEYEVVNLHKDLRHLLLMAWRDSGKEKFLCGFDERHWFVCAVPGNGITNVKNPLEAFQPAPIREEILRKVRRQKNFLHRRNEAFIRQGEWFFVPKPELDVTPSFVNPIYRNEPISRGIGSKAHICEEVFREGGEPVYVCSHYQNGVTFEQYEEIVKTNPYAHKWNWQIRRINANVYARGKVRHPDHKTVILDGWHQVFMNTENQAPAMRHVVFLD